MAILLKAGAVVRYEGQRYILARIDCDNMKFIGTRDGNRWSDKPITGNGISWDDTKKLFRLFSDTKDRVKLIRRRVK